MKIAVCLSGAIRYPHIGLKSIKNIFPNDHVKIFIHTWKISNREEFLKLLRNQKSASTLNTPEVSL